MDIKLENTVLFNVLTLFSLQAEVVENEEVLYLCRRASALSHFDSILLSEHRGPEVQTQLPLSALTHVSDAD